MRSYPVAFAYVLLGLTRLAKGAFFLFISWLAGVGVITVVILGPVFVFFRWFPKAPAWLALIVPLVPLLLFLQTGLSTVCFDSSKEILRSSLGEFVSGRFMIKRAAALCRERKRFLAAKRGQFLLVLRSWVSLEELGDRSRYYKGEFPSSPVSRTDREWAHAFITLLSQVFPLPVICLADPGDTVLFRSDHVVSPLLLLAWKRQVHELIQTAGIIIAIDVRSSDRVNVGFVQELKWILELGKQNDTLLAVIGREEASDRGYWTVNDWTRHFMAFFATRSYSMIKDPAAIAQEFPHTAIVSDEKVIVHVEPTCETIREAARLLLEAEHPTHRALRFHKGYLDSLVSPNLDSKV